MSKTVVHKVSVIIPTFNRPHSLREALASVRALERPDIELEILVGDNGSAPETRAIAREYGAIYAPATHRVGASVGRNAGLRAATGQYLAFLDDDDVWLPGHLRSHINLLEAQPEFAAVVGQIVYSDGERTPVQDPWPTTLPADGNLFVTMLSGYKPQIGATVARASILNTIGEFDENTRYGEDWDWHLRLARRHRIGFVAVPSVLSKLRDPGSSDDLQLRYTGYARRVFFRHAVRSSEMLKEPKKARSAYRQVLQQYYDYFVDAASTRAKDGNRKGALKAILGACRVFPIRAAFHLLAPRPLRQASLATLSLYLHPFI